MEVRKPLSEKAMSTHQTLRVQVTDTNQRPRGVMTIEADFDHLGPYRVQHDGQPTGSPANPAPTAPVAWPPAKWDR
jgi:hypothetical protein